MASLAAMRRWSPVAVAVLVGVAGVAALRADRHQAQLAIRVTVAPRCAVVTAPEGRVTLRCTKGHPLVRVGGGTGRASVLRLAPPRAGVNGVAGSPPLAIRAGATTVVSIDF